MRDLIFNLAIALGRDTPFGRPGTTANDPLIETRGVIIRIGTLSLSRLKFASCAVRYYPSVRKELTTSNMKFATLEYFEFQWKALKDIKKDQTDSSLPKLTKNLQVMKWTPLITAFWATQIGARGMFLSPMLLGTIPMWDLQEPWLHIDHFPMTLMIFPKSLLKESATIMPCSGATISLSTNS